MIGRRGERGSGISVLAARRDDDDIYIFHELNIYMSNIYLFIIYINKVCQQMTHKG